MAMQFSNTSLSNAAYQFIHTQLYGDKFQQQRAQYLSDFKAKYPGFMKVVFEAVRLFIGTNVGLKKQNFALILLQDILLNQSFVELQGSDFYQNDNYSLTNFLTALLLSGGDPEFKMLIEFLQNDEIIDNYTDSANVAVKIPLVLALINSGFVQQIFKFLEKERGQTARCVRVIEILINLVGGGFCRSNAEQAANVRVFARQSVMRHVQLLADLFHSGAYYYILNLTQQTETNSISIQIMQNVLRMCNKLLEDDGKSQVHLQLNQIFNQSKIFDYSAILVCAPNDEQLGYEEELTVEAILLLQKLLKGNPNSQTKFAITVIS